MSSQLKVGLLLSTSDSASFARFIHQAQSLHVKGHTLYAYLIHTAVLCWNLPELIRLQQQGLHLHLCSLAAEKHHIPANEQAIFCGLGTLASLIQHTDIFHSFSTQSTSPSQMGPHQIVHLSTSAQSYEQAETRRETIRIAAGLAQLSTLHVRLELVPADLVDPECQENVNLLKEMKGEINTKQKTSGQPSLNLIIG
ncbi:MAG: hypothetical protein SH807_11650 [Blastochloris sp.]|jgi:hypothetical protein|nr:hypothetical protein [Blastochloris sp.]